MYIIILAIIGAATFFMSKNIKESTEIVVFFILVVIYIFLGTLINDLTLSCLGHALGWVGYSIMLIIWWGFSGIASIIASDKYTHAIIPPLAALIILLIINGVIS